MTKIETSKNMMQKLPDGWRWVKLKDIGAFEAGGTPAKENPGYWSGEIPFVTGADITDIYITKANARAFLTSEGLNSGKTVICYPGTILIVTRTRVGRVGIVQETMGASQDITAFKCAEPIQNEYLCRYLNSISKHLIDNCRGATIQGLTRDFVDNLEIPLPSLPEQQRIAAILKEQMVAVDKARAAAQVRLEAVKALPAAFLRQVFPRPGQPLPDGWRSVKLGDISDGPGQYGTSTKSNADQRGIPVLGMYHIHEGNIRWENVFHVDLQADELSKYRLRKGDLLFNRTNSADLVGKTAVYDNDTPASFASYLIRFRFIEGRADPHFISAYVNSRDGRSFIEKNMTRAIGQANISASTMRMMPIPLPTLAEQQLIACVLSEQMVAVDKARAAVVAELETINALPLALLRRAFTGKL